MFKSSRSKTYDLSNWNPYYVISIIFFLCLLAGKNYYCDKFYLVSKLPKDRNETSIVKSIDIIQNQNIFKFNIKIDYIFKITKIVFIREFSIKFESDKFIYIAKEDSSFYSSSFKKNEWNFEVILPFTSDKIEISYLYRDIIFHKETRKFDVTDFSVVMSGSSYATTNGNSVSLSHVCINDQNLLTFFPNSFELRYMYEIEQNYLNESYEEFIQNDNVTMAPDNSMIYFASYRNLYPYKSLFDSFIPMMISYNQELTKSQKYVTYRPSHIFYYTDTYSPLLKILQAFKDIHILYNPTFITCFSHVFVPYHSTNITKEFAKTTIKHDNDKANRTKDLDFEENRNNLNTFRNIINTKQEANKVVIINCDLIQKITNLYPYINEKYKFSKIITLDMNTDPEIYLNSPASAKAIFIGTNLGMLSLIAVPPNCVIHKIIEKERNSSYYGEDQYLSILGNEIIYENVEESLTGYQLVF